MHVVKRALEVLNASCTQRVKEFDFEGFRFMIMMFRVWVLCVGASVDWAGGGYVEGFSLHAQGSSRGLDYATCRAIHVLTCNVTLGFRV